MTAYVSAFDLFSIGIGPSSSHTVGPMRAARAFAQQLAESGELAQVQKITCTLYGSLGSTGVGHGTPDAVLAGLAAETPENCDPAAVRGKWLHLRDHSPGSLLLNGTQQIAIGYDDIVFAPLTRLPEHPNALKFTTWKNTHEEPFAESIFYSIGGGFIRREGEKANLAPSSTHPLPFESAEQLVKICAEHKLSVADVARTNETALHAGKSIDARLDTIWAAMERCVTQGLHTSGTLPGGLGVQRRAERLRERLEKAGNDRDTSIEWLHAFALAVNEENASGGTVVTAPTNGAAGIVPAVGHYYLRFVPGASPEGIRDYLLTATAIGSLFKTNASISGAEAGCQGEVGSACAMAAAGLCAVLGGTVEQVENAAEIAMEHHLGLTCDPIGGLVQVPCIERNAIASSTAVSAARLALHGDGTHLVSLDAVIETMRQTGLDMSTKYKETSEGGLAVNVIEC